MSVTIGSNYISGLGVGGLTDNSIIQANLNNLQFARYSYSTTNYTEYTDYVANGFVFKYGRVPSLPSGTAYTYFFNSAFPTRFVTSNIGQYNTPDNNNDYWPLKITGFRTGFVVRNTSDSTTVGAMWICIGN